MRIALLSERGSPTPPVTQGGTERAVDMLARGLRQEGHHVTVWAQPGSRTLDYEVRPYPPRPAFLKPEDLDALRDFDVIHAHWMGPNWTGFRYLERLLALKGRLVQTYHGTFPYYIRPYSLWLRSLRSKARPHFVTQTRQQVDYARRHGIPNVTLIPNPVADLPFSGRVDDYFLYFGRVIPGKGVDTAIHVAQRAGVKLLIAGRADPRFAKSAVEPFLSQDIRFLGEVDDATRNRLLAHARGLLFPSRFPEGMPLTVLEANACGTPVISSTSYGAAFDVIQDGVNGFLCDSITQMVAATEKIDQIDRRACRDSVRRRFSMERTTQQHLELYRRVFELCEERRPSASASGAPTLVDAAGT